MGSSYLSHILLPKDSYIKLLYNEIHMNRRYYYYHVLTLNNCTVTTLKIDMLQESYTVMKIIHTQILGNDDYFICATNLGKNDIYISNCQFVSNSYKTYLFSFASSSIGSVQFINCEFIDNADDFYSEIISPWFIGKGEVP